MKIFPHFSLTPFTFSPGVKNAKYKCRSKGLGDVLRYALDALRSKNDIHRRTRRKLQRLEKDLSLSQRHSFSSRCSFNRTDDLFHFSIFKQSLHAEGRPQGPLDDVYMSGSSHQVKMWRASRKNEGRFSRFFENYLGRMELFLRCPSIISLITFRSCR